MAHLRRLTKSDIPECRSLWSQRFHDTDPFMDWYFSERFQPECSTCVQVDDQIVSMIHGRVIPLRFGNATHRAMMVAGGCTRPEFERRGYYRAALWSIGKIAEEEQACEMLILHPSDPEIYRTLGFRTFTYANYAPAAGTALLAPESNADASALLRCYDAAGAGYACFPERLIADMESRIRDMESGEETLVTVRGPHGVEGYAFYRLADGEAPEVLARDASAYRVLLSGMPVGVTAKLPPDVSVPGELRSDLLAMPLGEHTLPDDSDDFQRFCPDEY